MAAAPQTIGSIRPWLTRVLTTSRPGSKFQFASRR
jgi:hypothetical protein